MSAEEWRPIPEAPGYLASSHGRINGPVSMLSQYIEKQGGYPAVGIHYPDGSHRTRCVHQLVAQAFYGMRPEGLVVRHLDGDPANNRLENLRYGTPSENAQDAVSHGRHWLARRTHCNHGHEFTPENTRPRVRAGKVQGRVCVTCSRVQGRRYEKAKAAARKTNEAA